MRSLFSPVLAVVVVPKEQRERKTEGAGRKPKPKRSDLPVTKSVAGVHGSDGDTPSPTPKELE